MSSEKNTKHWECKTASSLLSQAGFCGRGWMRGGPEGELHLVFDLSDLIRAQRETIEHTRQLDYTLNSNFIHSQIDCIRYEFRKCNLARLYRVYRSCMLSMTTRALSGDNLSGMSSGEVDELWPWLLAAMRASCAICVSDHEDGP
jgi:hypothetical protein